MSCRVHYANQIRQDILNTINIDGTTAKLLQPNVILFPVGSEKIKTKEQSLEWAKRHINSLNKKYISKEYGPVVIISDKPANGTIVEITISKALLDGFERKYGTQTDMFDKMPNLDTSVNKKNITEDQLKVQIDVLFKDYILANKINIQFFDSLKELYGDDVVAMYDTVTKLIEVNTGKANIEVIAEELAHHLTTALGNDHTLVKRALTLINRVDYKGILGKEYQMLYNNDSNLLKHELLGKLIARRLANPSLPIELKSENGNKLWETIEKLWRAFISLFKPNANIEAQLEPLIDELAQMISKGNKIESTNEGFSAKLANVKTKLMDKDILNQYVYYKGRLDKLKQNNDDGKHNDEINKIEAVLNELKKNKNKQVLRNLTEDTLNTIEAFIEALNQNNYKDNTRHIEETLQTLTLFAKVKGFETRVAGLRDKLREYSILAAKDYMSSVTNKTAEEIDAELDKIDTDISFLEKGFGTLADVKNIIGKSIGLLIKKAQSIIERKNKESYNEITKYVDGLKSWGSKNGKTLNEVYDMFNQEHRGTYELVKPYSKEFYDEINASFNYEDGNVRRNKIATYDNNTKSWIPKDKTKYGNKTFDIIQNNPELKDFYNYFKTTIKEYKKKIGFEFGGEDFIPNIVEETMLDILKSDKAIGEKLKDSANHILQADVWDEEMYDVLLDEDLKKDKIPLKYTKKLDTKRKSKDLGSVLLQFSYFVNSYEQLNEVLPQTRLVQDLLLESKLKKKGNEKYAISGGESNLNEMIEGFIKMQIIGDKKKDSQKEWSPYVDLGIRYTSLLRIGLNLSNAISNLGIGNIGNYIEAFGGRYFGIGEYTKAVGIFTVEALQKDSKTNKLIEIINPLLEMDDYENLKNIKVGSKAYKERIHSLMYGPQRIGEKQMQTSTMIAIMMHEKVKTKDGNEISLWEAFDENGKWKTELMGYEISEDRILQLTNKVHRINQMIHGRYSAKDAPIWMQGALFRMVFQFKKWIPAAIESRLGGERFDDRLGKTIKGRYRSYSLFFKSEFWSNIGNILLNDIEAAEKGGMSEVDVYNMRKNLIEAILMVSIMLIAMGYDDEDKRKEPGYKFAMNQLNRLSGDLLLFYNPNEAIRQVTTGAPSLKTAQDLLRLIKHIPTIVTGEEYDSGPRKYEIKFWASAKDVIVVLKPATDIVRLWNDNPYIDF